MMSEKGKATSLLDMGNKFIEFLQKSNSNTQAWELLDSRLSSFYGATLKVQMPYAKAIQKDGTEYIPSFFVSIQHTDVRSNTYADWLRGTYGVLENGDTAYTKSGIYAGHRYYSYYMSEAYDHVTSLRDSTRSIYTKYGTANRENMFKNTGEFLAFGLHTSYDENLWMCEQGGITCEKEAKKQINALNFLPGRSIIYPRKSGSPSYEGGRISTLPVFPGTGCPWLTLSDKNKTDFYVDDVGIKYWFTKHNYHATITFRVGYASDFEAWQSISLGRLDLVDYDSYLFPLYVGGGNQALSQDIYRFTPTRNDCPTYTAGNVYDLDVKNICLSNSNILHATKFNNADMSNFRIMSPSGEWIDIYNHTQATSIVQHPTCSLNCTANVYSNILVSPVIGAGMGMETSFPHGNSFLHRIDTYTIKEELNQYKHSTNLDRVVVGLKRTIKPETNGLMGVVPNLYSSWSLSAKAGEKEDKGIEYLFVPNGWDGRLWYYPTYVGQLAYTENDWARQNIENRIIGTNVIHGHLVIPLTEEGD